MPHQTKDKTANIDEVYFPYYVPYHKSPSSSIILYRTRVIKVSLLA